MPRIELDDVATLPEPVRALFPKADTGKFVFDPEAQPEVAGLKVSHTRYKNEVAALKGQVDTWAQLGRKPDELQADLAELAKFRAGQQVDPQLAAKLEQAGAEIKKRDEALANALGQLEQVMVRSELLTKLQPIAISPTMMLPHAMENVRMVAGDDGKYRVVVLDEKGQPRVKDMQGTPFTLDDHLAELQTKRDDLKAGWTAKVGGGGGGGRGGPGGGPSAITHTSQFKSPSEKAAWISAHGEEAYRSLVESSIAADRQAAAAAQGPVRR